MSTTPMATAARYFIGPHSLGLLTLVSFGCGSDGAAPSVATRAAPMDASMPNHDGGQVPPGYDAGVYAADPCIEAGTCPIGVWIKVTPKIDLSGNSYNGDNFGVQDVMVDPMKPNELYFFVCFQGLWKSTDYGATWTGPINTGVGSDMIMTGKPWAAAIDPTPRDPKAPPTMWVAVGDSGIAIGALKSIDGGVSWISYPTHNAIAGAENSIFGESPYSIYVDPHDGKHLLTGFHGVPGLSESVDGGMTWTTITTVTPAMGSSLYPFFIDVADADASRKNWVIVSQDGGNNGTWHTADGGATWAQVGAFDHAHGNSQLVALGNGVAYLGATGGVYKTTNGGAMWSLVTPVNSYNSNGIVATATTLYASNGGATGGFNDPVLLTATISDDTMWTKTTAPTEMTNGAKRMAVTFDGTHHILVSGNWDAGLWRYIEP